MAEYRIVDRSGAQVAGPWTTLEEANDELEQLMEATAALAPEAAFTVEQRPVGEWSVVYHAAH